MRVRLTLEFDMVDEPVEVDDELIKFSQDQLLDAIRVKDNDIIDGLEITTEMDGCDNQVDFFIKSYSACVASAEILDPIPEFKRDEITVEDMEVEDDGESVSSLCNCWFDVDKKFGIDTRDDDTWVNFYAQYYPKQDEVKCEFFVNKSNDNQCYTYIPTNDEKELLKTLMEEFCMKEEQKSVQEFIDYINQTQSADLT